MTDELTEVPERLNRLPDDAYAEKKAALKSRKAFAAVFSPFVRAMREAIAEYFTVRAQGVQREDAIKGLAFTLREVWPKQVTKFPAKCDGCDDTGYQEFVCRPYARCQRESCQRKGEEWQHRYVRPCECDKGRRFEPKLWVAPSEQEQIGKVKPPKKSWSRMGMGS